MDMKNQKRLDKSTVLRKIEDSRNSPILTTRRAATAAAVAAALTLSACAGGEGNASDNAGEGFEFGASQEAVNEAIADLEPVTLTYQPPAASPNSLMAPAALDYQEYIEERSNGKITLDIVWGQSIASYPETFEALADGRLDIAWTLPIYDPAEFPTYDAMSTALIGLSSSPYTGEAIYNAVATEMAWQTDELLAEYEALGLVPLQPFSSSGGYYGSCNAAAEDSEDWQGRQIRIASTAHLGVVENMDATPVSLEYVETYEGLQRGTVDCTLGVLPVAAEGGISEVAPHLTYPSDEAMLSRAVTAKLAGSAFHDLPLAYQQIIFDATAVAYSGTNEYIVRGNATEIGQVKEQGGTVENFSPDVEEKIIEAQEMQAQEAYESGLLPDDFESQVQTSLEKWTGIVEELGISDGGSVEDMDEWYDDESTDFRPLGDRVVEEVLLSHRPQ
jgi:TRAP-type C4-dicarboxylate transport system substrate-binding protein